MWSGHLIWVLSSHWRIYHGSIFIEDSSVANVCLANWRNCQRVCCFLSSLGHISYWAKYVQLFEPISSFHLQQLWKHKRRLPAQYSISSPLWSLLSHHVTFKDLLSYHVWKSEPLALVPKPVKAQNAWKLWKSRRAGSGFRGGWAPTADHQRDPPQVANALLRWQNRLRTPLRISPCFPCYFYCFCWGCCCCYFWWWWWSCCAYWWHWLWRCV